MPIGGGRPLVAPFMRDKVPDSDTTLPRTLKCRCHSARAPSPGSAIKIALYPALSQGDAGIFGRLQIAAGGAVAVSVSLAPERPRARERLSPALTLCGQASPDPVVHSAHDAVPAARQRCAGPNRRLHLRTTPCRGLGFRDGKRPVWRPPMILL